MSRLNKARNLIGENRTLISNFGYLGVLQALNMVLPLVTYPYLIRVLGLELFGSVIFAQTVGFFAGILVNYGFNITGTRRVAMLRNDRLELSKYVSTVMTSKGLLWITSFILLLIVVLSVPRLRSDKWLFLISFGISFNEFLVPVWFFQGIEKMKYLTLVNFISRTASVILVFTVVHSSEDYLWVPAMLGTGALIAGLISLYLMFHKENLHFKAVSWTEVIVELSEGFPVFLSRVAGTITERANIILIGSFVGASSVTIYDFVIKVLSLFKIPIEILVRTVYPRISMTHNTRLARRSFWLAVGWGLTGGILAIVMAPWIIALVGPKQLSGLESYLYFILPLLVLMATSWSLGQPFILAFGHIRLASSISIATNVFYLIGAMILVFNGMITVVHCLILMILVEIFGFIMRVYHVHRLKIWKAESSHA